MEARRRDVETSELVRTEYGQKFNHSTDIERYQIAECKLPDVSKWTQ